MLVNHKREDEKERTLSSDVKGNFPGISYSSKSIQMPHKKISKLQRDQHEPLAIFRFPLIFNKSLMFSRNNPRSSLPQQMPPPPPPAYGLPSPLDENLPVPEVTPTEEVSSKTLPYEFDRQVSTLEKWAKRNKKNSRNDFIYFWTLKGIAIFFSAFSAVFIYFNSEILTIFVSSFAALCIALDGVIHPGMLRNIHLTAFHEIRELEHTIVDMWSLGISCGENIKQLKRRIYQKIMIDKKRISEYLKTAEASLGARF